MADEKKENLDSTAAVFFQISVKIAKHMAKSFKKWMDNSEIRCYFLFSSVILLFHEQLVVKRRCFFLSDDGVFPTAYNMFVKTDTGLLKLESHVTLEKIVSKHFFGVRQVQLYYQKKA